MPSSDTATTLGAAILAGVGTGVYAGFEDAVAKTVRIRRVHTPDAAAHRRYEPIFREYRELYERLKGLMKSREEETAP